eukprot:3438855-Ditylum_brightwellii.AAC.1
MENTIYKTGEQGTDTVGSSTVVFPFVSVGKYRVMSFSKSAKSVLINLADESDDSDDSSMKAV